MRRRLGSAQIGGNFPRFRGLHRSLFLDGRYFRRLFRFHCRSFGYCRPICFFCRSAKLLKSGLTFNLHRFERRYFLRSG